MEDSSPKKKKLKNFIIAILAIIVLLQAFALVRQGQRQTALEKRQRETFSQAASPASIQAQAGKGPAGRNAMAQRAAYEDPWEAFDDMSSHMNSLMRHALMFGAPIFQNMPQNNTGFDFTPAVDLEETKDAYIVKSDLPGLEKDKINLTVREGVLTLEGVRETTNETQDKKGGFYAQERSYGSFARSLRLPGPVDESKISAAYQNGVLTITLPKTSGQKSAQKVTIQ